MDHILGQKINPNTLNKTEILQECPLASVVRLKVNNEGIWKISKHLEMKPRPAQYPGINSD